MHQLALWRRVVFVDWHGVLSRDPFWISIRESATHPLRARLDAGLVGIFADERVNEWMKGRLSSEQIIDTIGIHLDGRFRDGFLRRRLDADCARMKVNAELVEALRAIKVQAWVVLATDNMDCFARTFDQARTRRRRTRHGSQTLADWAVICDDIICSSDVGALKAEDPVGFFGRWLAEHDLDFAEAVLIDDRADNCAAFAGQGGTAILYRMSTDAVTGVIEALYEWSRVRGERAGVYADAEDVRAHLRAAMYSLLNCPKWERARSLPIPPAQLDETHRDTPHDPARGTGAQSPIHDGPSRLAHGSSLSA